MACVLCRLQDRTDGACCATPEQPWAQAKRQQAADPAQNQARPLPLHSSFTCPPSARPSGAKLITVSALRRERPASPCGPSWCRVSVSAWPVALHKPRRAKAICKAPRVEAPAPAAISAAGPCRRRRRPCRHPAPQPAWRPSSRAPRWAAGWQDSGTAPPDPSEYGRAELWAAPMWQAARKGYRGTSAAAPARRRLRSTPLSCCSRSRSLPLPCYRTTHFWGEHGSAALWAAPMGHAARTTHPPAAVAAHSRLRSTPLPRSAPMFPCSRPLPRPCGKLGVRYRCEWPPQPFSCVGSRSGGASHSPRDSHSPWCALPPAACRACLTR